MKDLNRVVASRADKRAGRKVLPLWLAAFLLACGARAAQPGTNAPLAATPGEGTPPAGVTATNAPAAKQDLAAARFMNTCAGCHSVFGIKLTGPELSHVSAWPPDQLTTAIKRMQEKVGPLKEEEVSGLGDLLRDAKLRDRLKAEEARIQAQFMAKMEPADPALGRSLFYGRVPLRNGGLACAACHPGEGDGGNLGLPLAGVQVKMGEMPLISAIEKGSFKIMEPHYRNHPVTKQEAMHLAKYLSTLDPARATARPLPFLPLGAGGALALFAGLTFYYRNQHNRRPGRPQRRR